MNFKFLLLSAILIFTPLAANSEEPNWITVADEAGNTLSSALALYKEGNVNGAKTKVADAYFEVFEEKGMETAVKMKISENRAYEVETMFANARKAVDQKLPPSELSNTINGLVSALKEDAGKLDKTAAAKEGGHPVSLFFDSFIIIVREGFEAILIISALIAYLIKTGHADKVGRIYLGAILAIVASIATAIILNTLLTVSGAAREGLEGATMLTAAAVLFYVSYWLISKAEAARWHSFIKEKIESSLSVRSLFALSSAAFLAVYREGAEAILFYQALFSGAGEGGAYTLLYGFAAGSVVLAAIYLAIRFMSIRVPLGPFFAVTSILLYYLAFSFAGRGVLELQVAGLLPATTVAFPTIHFLGIYPTREGLLLQGMLLIAAILAALYALYASYVGKGHLKDRGER